MKHIIIPLLAASSLLAVLPALDHQHEMTGSFHNITGVRGAPAGGTLTLGTVQNHQATYTVETVAGDTLQDVYARFQALPLPEGGPFDGFTLENDLLGVAGGLPGFFFTTTDPGVILAPGAENFRATASATTGSVTLTWTLPNGAPEKQFLWRDRRLLARLDGETTYTDSLVGSDFDLTLEYQITCFASEPGIGLVYPSPPAKVLTQNPTAMTSDAFEVSTRSLAVGVTGRDYHAQLAKNAGTDPVSWSIAGGDLPPGLTLAPNGSMSGTVGDVPSDPTAFTFTVSVTDTNGTTTSAALELKVCHHPPFDGAVGEHGAHSDGGHGDQEH